MGSLFIFNADLSNAFTSSVLADREDEVECELQTTIDEKALERSALKINKEYEEKIELGKALYKILNKGVVQEESFPPEWQKALDLYLKQGHQIDPETVVLPNS